MSEARPKTMFKALAGALIAAALVVTPLVTVSASAKDSAPVSLEGQTGVMKPWTQETNHVEYWERVYPGATCVKGESSLGKVTVSETGKSVTLDAPPAGQQWTALIIKAGNVWNDVVDSPKTGVAYASPVNNGGQQAVVSHWIACAGPATTVVQPPKPEPVSTDKVVTTFACGADRTITTTTTTADWVWDAASLKWVLGAPVSGEPVITHQPLTPTEVESCTSETPPPTVTVTYGKWTDAKWACGDTTVTQTRVVTTTTTPSEGAPTTTAKTETRTRDLTQEEVGACALVPGEVPVVDPKGTPTSSAIPTPAAAPAATGDLATTGGTGVSPIVVVSGAAALAAGIAIVAIAGYRRRRAGTE
ncbi:hypothetical protein [Microbacterium candidum]|uniref:LPXTG cell wall anchor domain-containing protein n=1 Tax=Microbacterium candidum TaxID=3041922 RepID=A0ABT7MXI5_9MICO|nr:hypothetical protein [Microbacterium sp. ASV49]MDL9979140.1 hypothetical protein [Microbacterium sp. ASV49]